MLLYLELHKCHILERFGVGCLGFVREHVICYLRVKNSLFQRCFNIPCTIPSPAIRSAPQSPPSLSSLRRTSRQDWGPRQGLVPFPHPAPRAGALEWVLLCGSNEAPVAVSDWHLHSHVILTKSRPCSGYSSCSSPQFFFMSLLFRLCFGVSLSNPASFVRFCLKRKFICLSSPAVERASLCAIAPSLSSWKGEENIIERMNKPQSKRTRSLSRSQWKSNNIFHTMSSHYFPNPSRFPTLPNVGKQSHENCSEGKQK